MISQAVFELAQAWADGQDVGPYLYDAILDCGPETIGELADAGSLGSSPLEKDHPRQWYSALETLAVHFLNQKDRLTKRLQDEEAGPCIPGLHKSANCSGCAIVDYVLQVAAARAEPPRSQSHS